jgi:hypothetical protein
LLINANKKDLLCSAKIAQSLLKVLRKKFIDLFDRQHFEKPFKKLIIKRAIKHFVYLA